MAAHDGRMDTSKARADLVFTLISERFGGSQVKFADAIDISPTTVSRWFMKGPGRKGIGERTARKIEIALRLRGGQLVVPTAILDKSTAAGVTLLHKPWPFRFRRERFDRLTKLQQGRIEERVLVMVEEFEADAKTDHADEPS
jgi:hypothetical protein